MTQVKYIQSYSSSFVVLKGRDFSADSRKDFPADLSFQVPYTCMHVIYPCFQSVFQGYSELEGGKLLRQYSNTCTVKYNFS